MEILDSEEKGSDVNLTTRLLTDGFNRDYEQAVVISNDSDFASPIRYVLDGLGLGIISNFTRHSRFRGNDGDFPTVG